MFQMFVPMPYKVRACGDLFSFVDTIILSGLAREAKISLSSYDSLQNICIYICRLFFP